MMEPGQIIGLDVGMRKTGIARASSVARLAEPLEAVPTDEVFNALKKLDSDQPLEAIVIGLPRGLNGQETDQTDWVRQWTDHAKKQLKTPFYWQDEALTSKLAAAQQTAKKPIDEDALAAAIILQDFLETPESDRALC